MAYVKMIISYLCHVVLCVSVSLLLSIPSQALAFQQKITELHAVKDVKIVVRYHDNVYWQMAVANVDPSETVSILWDKSYYTSSSGRRSRLIDQKNKDIRPEAKQRVSRILPGQKTVMGFTSEDLLPYVSMGPPTPSDPSSPGRLTIAISKKGIIANWIGAVSFID